MAARDLRPRAHSVHSDAPGRGAGGGEGFRVGRAPAAEGERGDGR